MRILLITLYYHPDRGGTPGVYKDLCESLHAAGHDVTVVTGFPRYNVKVTDTKYRHRLWLTERIGGVEVKRIRTFQLPRCFPAARALDYLLTAVLLFFRALFVRRADAAIIHSPTLYEGVAAPILRNIKRMPYVLNVHDIFPQTAIDLGLLKNRWLIGIFETLERYAYTAADSITVHSDGNRKWIEARHKGIKRLEVMPIWMNPDALMPGPRENRWRAKLGLNGEFLAVFSGSQGYNQDIRVILNAAKELRAEKGVEFIIIGNGTQHEEMVQQSQAMGLNNVRWLDWQPDEEYPLVLHSADVVLVTLKSEVRTPVVPSKVLSAMSAGRPVITCAPLAGDAPKLVLEAHAGYAIDPGDHHALVHAIKELVGNPELGQQFGESARHHVERFLDVKLWAQAYVGLFAELNTSIGVTKAPKPAISLATNDQAIPKSTIASPEMVGVSSAEESMSTGHQHIVDLDEHRVPQREESWSKTGA